MALAVAALFAAALSIWLAAGTAGESAQRATTDASVPRDPEKDAQSSPGEYARVEGPVRSLAPLGDPSGNDIGSSTAFCPSHMRVVSGGFETIAGSGGVFYSGALTVGRVGWTVGAVNDLAQSGTVQAFAYCVRTGQPASARGGRRLERQRAAGRREVEALVNRYRLLSAAQR
jgi:hypothetical protein